MNSIDNLQSESNVIRLLFGEQEEWLLETLTAIEDCKSLDMVVGSLTSLHSSYNGSDDSQHLIIVAKYVDVLKRVLMDQSLLLMPRFSMEIARLDIQLRGSSSMLLLYGLQTAPARLTSFIKRQFDRSSLWDYRSIHLVGSFKSMLKRELLAKKTRLVSARDAHARSVGVLVRSATIDNPDALHATGFDGLCVSVSKLLKKHRLLGGNATISDQTRLAINKLLSSHVTHELGLVHSMALKLAEIGCSDACDDESMGDLNKYLVEPPVSVGDLYTRVETTANILRAVSPVSTQILKTYGQPHWLIRSWIPIAAVSIVTYTLLKSADIPTAFESLKTATVEAFQTCTLFLRNWILDPISQIFKTIRHDEGRLALLGTESLNSDLESLERMVVEFSKDHGDSLSAAEIGSRVRSGNLTLVMENYEQDIKKPLRNFLAGDLIRSLLIQIQKAKVDGELAMSALDKLLKSNELNFAFLAVMPTLALTYGTYSWISHSWSQHSPSTIQTLQVMKTSLRDIERILNNLAAKLSSRHDAAYSYGLLICELRLLQSCLSNIPDYVFDKARFKQDLDDFELVVMNDPIVNVTGLNILNRIFRLHFK